jgi:hypothetical protein
MPTSRVRAIRFIQHQLYCHDSEVQGINSHAETIGRGKHLTAIVICTTL